MAIISYLQIFPTFFSNLLLLLFPGSIRYKESIFIILIISIILLVPKILKNRILLYNTIVALIIFSIIITLYYITSFYYPSFNLRYNSFLLVLSGPVLVSILTGIYIAYNKKDQMIFKRCAFIFGLLFTIISFLAAFFPTSHTSGGFVDNENGLNYQTTSYLTAYAAGLNFYSLIFIHKIKFFFFNIFRSNLFIKLILFISLLINLLSCLVSGGRGGFVLLLVVFIFSFYVYNKVQKNKNLRLLLFGVIGILFIYFSFSYITSFKIETNGISRIYDFLVYHDQNGRDIGRKIAFEKIQGSPFFGYGLGSVFFELGMYTHNLLLDSLVEIGIIGTIIFSIIIFYVCYILYKLLKEDITNSIWIIIFLDGLMMSMFSGYYLAQVSIFWIISFTLSYKLYSKIDNNNFIFMKESNNT